MTNTAHDRKTIADALIKSVRGAAVYNSNVEVAPACILWPDGDRQWEPVASRLQGEMPELCVLGDFNPDTRTGPAIWLRMVIADRYDGVKIPSGMIPVLYLPGVRRQDLRAVTECPDRLKPLAELQYRGAIWSQVNSKDWTIASFLGSNQGGLGLDVAGDNEAKTAMRLSLFRLLDKRLDLLRDKPLTKDYFNELLTSGDPIRELLLWLNDSVTFRQQYDTNAWNAFVELCKSQFRFDPSQDGELEAAIRLAERAAPWDSVWQRFAEAPHKYPRIPDQIRKTSLPTASTLFPDFGGWPQWNEGQEDDLRSSLMALSQSTPEEAREKVLAAEVAHKGRRDEVWAELGMSPLAMSLRQLARLATITADSLAAGTAADMAAAYRSSGWQADDAMMRSLEYVSTDEDVEAVTAAISAVYTPWATDAAFHLQKTVSLDGYPGGSHATLSSTEHDDGTCFLFVDGLRFDLAQRLRERLNDAGLQPETNVRWAALPSVTATAKPSVTPVAKFITGGECNVDFNPDVKVGESTEGKSLSGGYQLHKLLEQNGWQKLSKSETGDTAGKAWCEFGDIDHAGHDRGWKLAKQVDTLLDEVASRVTQLLGAGWQQVRVVTDHGWLLMPGGLPDTKLSPSLSDNKWGRCASLKPGCVSDERMFPWFWNPTQEFALAGGISCYRKNVQYAHGGLTLQECLTMSLVIHAKASGKATANTSQGLGDLITDIQWKQMRCTVTLGTIPDGAQLDVRTHAGNPETSEVVQLKPFADKHRCSVIIEDDDLEGHSCWVVILDSDGQPLAQSSTTVGGEDS